MPKLVITDNEGSHTLALDREVKAGRLSENEIQLKVPEASRHHCRFFGEKGTWFVEDMGSSNGTLVNGRKVSKFELQDGDLISVGAVTMRFLDTVATAEEKGEAAGGWGDDEISLDADVSKPFVEEDLAPVEVRDADTQILDTESAFADPTFALSEVPEKKSPLPSILAILLLLGLAGGLAWLYINRGKLSGDNSQGGGGPVRFASNLVPQKFWSFEPHEIDPSGEDQAGWHKEDAVDAASTGEVQDPVHSGDQAYSISRRETEKPGDATWVSLSGGPECDIALLPGSAYRVSGWVYVDSGKPIPGISVIWIEPVTGEKPREVSREVLPANPPADKWTEIAGFVQVPEGATRAHVGVVSGGTGDVVFDDLVIEPAPAPAGRSVEVRSFRAWLTSGGALRVFHFARPVSDGMGIWRETEGGLEAPWQVLVPRGDASSSGTLRDGGADLAITLTSAESAFNVKWQLSGPAPGHPIIVPLPGSPDEINVTLLEGDRARRMRAAFQKASASGVIVGGHGDRMRIRFLDAEGKPFVAPLDVVVEGGRALLKLDRGDRTTVVFQCDLSFDAEMNQARELLARASDAASKHKLGEAMTLYEEVLARFPFDETMERQASGALEKLASDGRARIRALAARVDDSKFFRTARIDDELLADLQADSERYANTKLHPEIKAKLDELVAERTKTAGDKNDAEAQAAFARAQDYLEMKQARREIAVMFLEMVVSRYPNTEWGQRARELLERLTGQAPESKPASRPN